MNKTDKEAHIFGSILTLSNRIQMLGDKLDQNISIKQWLLIAVITKWEHPSPTLGEVANYMGTSRQNVKKMAVILQEKGFILLTKDISDARILRMALTAKCLDYFAARDEMETQFMNALFDQFDETLTEGLFQGILKLTENMIEMEKDND